MKRLRFLFVLTILAFCSATRARAQSLGNAGTITGTVLDPSGSAIPKAEVSVRNAVTGYNQSVTSGTDGSFRINNVPPNPYHLEVKASGFAAFSQDVDIKNSLPVQVKATLALASSQTSVTVEGAAEALETDPSAHVDVDRSQMLKIPSFDPAGGLSQAIIY
jgi:hypothetical protein